MSRRTLVTAFVLWAVAHVAMAQDSAPVPSDGAETIPADFTSLWGDFDPRAEPLETEVLREWEEDGVTLRVVRFRIGAFKGTVARLAGIYGFPKDRPNGARLPGLLQIHGGGQYADYRACLTNARRGYATLSIAWAGRINAPDYTVDPQGVQRFWDQATDDPNYRLTTDWGAVDGYHAPSRAPNSAFPVIRPSEWTIDPEDSPRNSGWYLAAYAARRGLTFLEQQGEVDPDRLGVYGHSMGGKLTVMTAVDPRVKAAAPSCGGISDRDNSHPLFRATLGDDVYLPRINIPIFFLSPANDFHGRIGDLPAAIREIDTEEWRVTCSPYHNHQDTPSHEVATQLWFDQHLLGTFQTPPTPTVGLDLDNENGEPRLSVVADRRLPIRSVTVYYTQHGLAYESPADREVTMNRYWHFASPRDVGDRWVTTLPVNRIDRPLWVYANVEYELPEPIRGAGYYYGDYEADSFTLSSLLIRVTPETLQANHVVPTLEPTPIIEDFQPGWERTWFSYSPQDWPRSTLKLADERWAAPAGSSLELQVRTETPNRLVVALDEYATEVALPGGDEWQTIRLNPGDFRNWSDEPLQHWQGRRLLKLTAAERLRPPARTAGEDKIIGGRWEGAAPTFRLLRWSADDESVPVLDGQSLLDLFPESSFRVAEERAGQTSVSDRFVPSGSLWADGLDEQLVFHRELRHDQSEENSYRLRMGRGGQLYSLRGAFGESVPPSFREPNQDASPWNDEVWQFVAVCTRYNGVAALQRTGSVPDETVQALNDCGYEFSYFVHNSGAYIPRESDRSTLYCPLLASTADAETRTLRMCNWGLVPQVRTIHRSPLLYYTQARDLGDGVIELTWVVHNFDSENGVVFEHLNAPWGGTRVTSLPVHRIASSSNQLSDREVYLLSENRGAVNVRQTGGWMISSVNETEESPSLAFVFGRDRHLESELARMSLQKPATQYASSLLRDWRASAPLYHPPDGRWSDWRTRPENSFRNYDVAVVIPKFRLRPTDTIWYRSYLVVNARESAIALAEELVDHVDYGLLDFPAADERPYEVEIPRSFLREGVGGGSPVRIELFTRPVSQCRPLFLLRDSETGKPALSCDPYLFVPQEPLDLPVPGNHPDHDYYSQAIGYRMDEHHSEWLGIVGFARATPPNEQGYVRLSTLLKPEVFPLEGRYQQDLWVRVADEP
ncbi:MAG: hypothetical protein KDA83_18860 [Planctomycetales bacterium]|nr:hypothetical protein [Planctomycetales bacterium]